MLNSVLYFFRDNISGVRYFIYTFVGIILIFAIIGYMFKLKYTKYGVRINIGNQAPKEPPKSKKEVAKEKKQEEKIKKEKAKEEAKDSKKKKSKKGSKDENTPSDLPAENKNTFQIPKKIPDVK